MNFFCTLYLNFQKFTNLIESIILFYLTFQPHLLYNSVVSNTQTHRLSNSPKLIDFLNLKTFQLLEITKLISKLIAYIEP
jgi:hypothetical protein